MTMLAVSMLAVSVLAVLVLAVIVLIEGTSFPAHRVTGV